MRRTLVPELYDRALPVERRRTDRDIAVAVGDGAGELVPMEVLVQPNGDPG